MIRTVMGAYLSPAGTTAKVVEVISHGVADAVSAKWQAFDWTPPKNREWKIEFEPEELLVIGVPTYAGRVPNKLMPYIRDNLFGDRTLALPVVTFGHRAYDDSLAELTTLLADNGFLPMGGAAVICEHSLIPSLATGEPGEKALAEAYAYGREAGRRALALLAGSAGEDREDGCDSGEAAGTQLADHLKAWREEVILAGHDVASYYQPLGKSGAPVDFLKAVPAVDPVKCTGCGCCAKVCPMDIITMEGAGAEAGGSGAEQPVFASPCIKCQSCVKRCPEGALAFDDPGYLSHVAHLEASFRDIECASEYYLAPAMDD